MLKKYFFLLLLCLPLLSEAQFFRAFAAYEGNDIVFSIQANPGGGDIMNKSWSDIEFFLRYPDTAPVFNYGAITINTSDFPGISMPYNGDNQQGSETGYVNSWFGTSYTPSSTLTTYTDGQVYEVFRVTLDINPALVDFELVANTSFVPTYLVLTDQSGGDLTAPSGNKFYGTATNCNCPAPSNNDVLVLSAALPVELLSFTVRATAEKQAQLDWSTASELNNKGFDIQRRNQGTDWETIGFEKGMGTTSLLSHYRFYDPQPFAGVNYYRLKQIDFDGQYEFSVIKSIVLEIRDTPYTIYPNPASDQLQLDQPFAGTLVIRNLLGQALQQKEYAEGIHTLDLSALAEGAYFLEIIPKESKPQTVPFVIQH